MVHIQGRRQRCCLPLDEVKGAKTIDRRSDSRGADRRDVPRYDLGGVFATLSSEDEKIAVVDIGDINVSTGVLNSPLQIDDKIKIPIHVPLTGKMATLPINGTVSRVTPESVVRRAELNLG
jgi:hypothetical protein